MNLFPKEEEQLDYTIKHCVLNCGETILKAHNGMRKDDYTNGSAKQIKKVRWTFTDPVTCPMSNFDIRVAFVYIFPIGFFPVP